MSEYVRAVHVLVTLAKQLESSARNMFTRSNSLLGESVLKTSRCLLAEALTLQSLVLSVVQSKRFSPVTLTLSAVQLGLSMSTSSITLASEYQRIDKGLKMLAKIIWYMNQPSCTVTLIGTTPVSQSQHQVRN